MSDKYTKKIINSLSEFLPPLVESITGILDHIQTEEEFYNKKLLEQLANVNHYSGELIRMIGTELRKVSIDSKNNHDDNVVATELLAEYYSAIKQVDKGISSLILLFIQEKDMTNMLSDKEWYKRISDNEMDVSIEVAVDNFYEGSKALVQIIDKVFD